MPKDGSDLEDSKIIMAVYIYRVELDSSVLKIARKEMQDTVDGTGLNLLKQTRKQKFNVKKTALFTRCYIIEKSAVFECVRISIE